ncbi:Segregation and condensation protein A [Rosistilla oblonga]|uniref:segregation and condensation protein A n=1 Tax=Rosistilla oblonga TaxID=2527990 RepID=UPI00118AE0DE|nr:segregation/condensation protein A [Rosistilla oblonga]QDV12579.1 Segregation and condensation protein A [Rosistilla oblonga]
MTFRIDLPAYRGPLDLLLYLVRRSELDITTMSLANVVDQYLEYLEVLQDLDVNGVGDFIDLASTLVEFKSKAVLPQADDEQEEEVLEDPQEELVERLLEYKRFRDASSILDEMGEQWQQRYPRIADDLPPRQIDPGDQPIADLELWDLVSAFGRIMRESSGPPPTQVVYDDTPIHVYMQRIHEQLLKVDEVRFSDLFDLGAHKSAMIGIFLAILELARHYGVSTRQEAGGIDIVVTRGERFETELNVSEVDNYDASAVDETNLPIKKSS